MFLRWKMVLLWTLPVVILACAVSAVLIRGTSSQNPVQPRTGKTRNLSLQPEAFKLSRRLGNRFASSRETSSTLAGTLITGTLRQEVNVVRKQTSSGEEVGIGVAGAALTWSDAEGPGASGANVNEGQRMLIERLVLDSPDQFVLAQLRGASYYTVAHDVRDDPGGSDNYDGPLWDVVRVTEPETDRGRRPLSNSRLYYLNVQTGLIDKIVSEFRGEKIEANVRQWVDQGGEKIPAHIVWKRGNETVQEFNLSSFTVQPQP
ncbi:MAG TPA: hypothetical protein VJT69_17415 [Pyrinomonadaceae bacterium]|nr:hypothetical protein [Pyrinomonadaceae bacterium]